MERHTCCALAIKGVRGEVVVHAFENHGIYISTTSACSSKKADSSSTLYAMDVPNEWATGAVRELLKRQYERRSGTVYKGSASVNETIFVLK